MEKNSRVQDCFYGKCLVVKNSCKKGTLVEKYEGLVVPWEQVCVEEICHAIWIKEEHWMIIDTNARYINHSCNPNCIIDDDLNVVTIRPVTAGEELTISYDIVKKGENPGNWDPRWNFKCECGSKNCRGRIDKYVNEDGTPWSPQPTIYPKIPLIH
ncbi:MAG: SET domain-containing protein-lysine N-methyltransferase [Candidatus Lokiarchaeota archaeon]|nr:SET domain-containing protein-lysine N-methyltransferase [Candidatus Lokiarchaeota archaeon]